MTIVNMEKSVIFLVIVGGLLATGIILSFYGAQLTTQNLIVNEGIVGLGESFEIQAELDPTKSETGVFVIQILDFKDNEITAKISDPLDYEILSKSFDKDSIEERFEIASKGTYKLIIENSSSEDIQIMAVIGYMPDKGTLSVGIIGFFILIVGLVGIVGVGIYVIRTKRKEKFN